VSERTGSCWSRRESAKPSSLLSTSRKTKNENSGEEAQIKYLTKKKKSRRPTFVDVRYPWRNREISCARMNHGVKDHKDQEKMSAVSRFAALRSTKGGLVGGTRARVGTCSKDQGEKGTSASRQKENTPPNNIDSRCQRGFPVELRPAVFRSKDQEIISTSRSSRRRGGGDKTPGLRGE